MAIKGAPLRPRHTHVCMHFLFYLTVFCSSSPRASISFSSRQGSLWVMDAPNSRRGISMRQECMMMGNDRVREKPVLFSSATDDPTSGTSQQEMLVMDYRGARCYCDPRTRLAPCAEDKCQGAMFLCRSQHGHFFWGSWCARRNRWLQAKEMPDVVAAMPIPERFKQEHIQKYGAKSY